MNQESFFEKLTGVFLDGSPLRGVPPEDRLSKSVGDHLYRLLNTRRGSLSHLPDYGMPDCAQLYRELPASFEEWKKLILGMIKKYEPRMSRVQIKQMPFNPVELKIKFVLSGYIDTEIPVTYNMGYTSMGRIELFHQDRGGL